jgi:hypothetical protein
MKTINPQQQIILSLLFLGLLFPLGAETGAENGAESLWRKARDYQNEAADWKPGSIAIATEEYNRKGEPVKSGFLHMVLDRGALPRLVYSVEEALENGRSITARSREDLDGRETGGFAETIIADPLTAEPSDLLLREPVPGRPGTYRFTLVQPSDRGEPLTFTGMIRLDPETGGPLELAYSAVGSPRVLKSMAVRVSYGPDASGIMLPREVVMEMRVKIFLMEKSVKITTRYGDYLYFPGAVSHE